MLLRKVVIEKFRRFEKIEIELDRITVLIGENNSGKTSFLDALRLCLERLLSRNRSTFEDYDHHLPDKSAQPGDAGTLSIVLDFAEEQAGQWSPELNQTISEIIVIHPGNIRHVTLRVASNYDKKTGAFLTDWEFLDPASKPLAGGRSKTPQTLLTFQRLCPIFYLPAVRDAIREFTARSSFWGPFLRNPSIDPKLRENLEEQLNALNEKVIDAHANLQKVKKHLGKTQSILSSGGADAVNIDALPGRLSDMLSRTQVSMTASTGAVLPLSRHGAGTQSLSVLFLFEAFLTSMLTEVYDKLSEPMIALEEPEAHLHPCAVRCLWSVLDSMSGQKIIATHSGDLLSEVPLSAVRRFCRVNGKSEVHQVGKATLGKDELRRVSLHIQSSRGELLFARSWLLIEGETEYWVFRRAAQILGADLDREGVRLVLYARVGPDTFAKVANDLRIDWFCVADNDDSGQRYQKSVRACLHGRPESEHVVLLPARNVEVFLCENGCGDVYLHHLSDQKKHLLKAKAGTPDYWPQVVDCLDRTPKESLALEAMELIAQEGKAAVPGKLKEIIDAVVTLARKQS